mmetsp:Transcript_21340/g.47204  ORF Transcript_21340/g.47204 Transcript_21340/m.47204 type:complete len:277 (-) Transcript_21340:322-1152(-)|eukprot:CAMPEP_0170586634 /NCGR_PEP_ID=MMETSP0224-20130122/9848_1 /TAXON_ID=285029 /ORGANISM="Togula jolla, Strain CCCM 725" /LENGTH=276 /DNA_ID=CAMNT_0010910191 /DNA_START=59 /DNA_END=889 /DNA_ORIENTATION=-
MPGHVYVGPQAGRAVRETEAEEPWGTTSSSAYRGYEPSEMRSCRGPAHVRTCLEPRLNHDGRRVELASNLSSASARHRATSGGSTRVPSWELIHRRPVPRNPFYGNSAYREDQERAQQARHAYFPYRDEFAPRSKRLLYEMALERCTRDSVRSASTEAGTASCFTLATSAASGKGSRRSASTPSLVSKAPTADSQRIEGGVARRRKECQLRSPMQWAADAAWLHQKLDEDGPAGLTQANFAPSLVGPSFKQHHDRIARVRHIFGGTTEQEIEKHNS